MRWNMVTSSSKQRHHRPIIANANAQSHGTSRTPSTHHQRYLANRHRQHRCRRRAVCRHWRAKMKWRREIKKRSAAIIIIRSQRVWLMIVAWLPTVVGRVAGTISESGAVVDRRAKQWKVERNGEYEQVVSMNFLLFYCILIKNLWRIVIDYSLCGNFERLYFCSGEKIESLQ